MGRSFPLLGQYVDAINHVVQTVMNGGDLIFDVHVEVVHVSANRPLAAEMDRNAKPSSAANSVNTAIRMMIA